MVILSKADKAAMPAILAAVLERPGITMLQIAEDLREPARRVSEVLTVLRREGKTMLIRYGRNNQPRWYPPELGRQVLETFKAEAAERRREQKRRYATQYNAARRIGLLDAAEDDRDDGKPIRRRVDASAPLPFKLRAPASVFHLGAGL